MSAASPLQNSSPSPEMRPREPSMEEILASIRRIIADDQALFVNRDESEPEPGFDGSEAEFTEAAEGASRETAPDAPASAEIFGGRRLAFGAGEPKRAADLPLAADRKSRVGAAEEPLAAGGPTPGAASAEPRLVSAATDGSVASAFNALLAARFVQNSDAIAAMIRELLRPMLTAWLDDHLPALVERLVRAEIERVTREG